MAEIREIYYVKGIGYFLSYAFYATLISELLL